MTIGRTHDLKMAVGKKNDLYFPTNILGGGIPGTTNIEPEPFLGQVHNQASVHSAGASVTFGTIYDTATFDAAIASLVGDSPTDPTDEMWYVVWSEAAPRMWRALPVDFAPPGSSSPAAGSITRSWAMTGRGRGYHGTTVVPFGPTTAGTALTIMEDHPASASMVLVLTNVAASVTDIDWADGRSATDLNADDRLIIATLSSSGTDDITITSTRGVLSGVLLVGEPDHLPSG